MEIKITEENHRTQIIVDSLYENINQGCIIAGCYVLVNQNGEYDDADLDSTFNIYYTADDYDTYTAEIGPAFRDDEGYLFENVADEINNTASKLVEKYIQEPQIAEFINAGVGLPLFDYYYNSENYYYKTSTDGKTLFLYKQILPTPAANIYGRTVYKITDDATIKAFLENFVGYDYSHGHLYFLLEAEYKIDKIFIG